jgi:uncharacterized membrane protein
LRSLYGEAGDERRGLLSVSFSAVGLGFCCGLRSALGPALLSRAASRGELRRLEDTPFAFAASRRISRALTLLAVGEMVADKTPVVPPRTAPPVLLARAVSGAASGAAISLAGSHSGRTGAVLGGASAVIAAIAGTRLRVAVGQRPSVPSLLPGLVEDTLAVGIGLLATSSQATETSTEPLSGR